MNSDSTDTTTVYPGPSKSLLRLVKFLGLVMVLLFLALIAGIIWKATHKPAPEVKQVVFDLGIDPASIRHLTLDGNNLAIATDREVLVIDIAKRSVILRTPKS